MNAKRRSGYIWEEAEAAGAAEASAVEEVLVEAAASGEAASAVDAGAADVAPVADAEVAASVEAASAADAAEVPPDAIVHDPAPSLLAVVQGITAAGDAGMDRADLTVEAAEVVASWDAAASF